MFMKKFKLNKKGFTLVELLAVIVILALLIVITANTILPMMNNSKKNAMVVYANRVLNAASSMYQADSISQGVEESQIYSIEKLMNQKDYYGCIEVSYNVDSESYEYTFFMLSPNDKLKLEGIVKSNSIKSKAADVVVEDKMILKDDPTFPEHTDCSSPDEGTIIEWPTNVIE